MIIIKESSRQGDQPFARLSNFQLEFLLAWLIFNRKYCRKSPRVGRGKRKRERQIHIMDLNGERELDAVCSIHVEKWLRVPNSCSFLSSHNGHTYTMKLSKVDNTPFFSLDYVSLYSFAKTKPANATEDSFYLHCNFFKWERTFFLQFQNLLFFVKC